MTTRIVSFIGLGSFDKVTESYAYNVARYMQPGYVGTAAAIPEDRFAVVATARRIAGGAPPEGVVVHPLLTVAARSQSWPVLQEDLNLIGLSGSSVCPLDIPDGATEDQLWEIFSSLLEVASEGDEVVLDVTNGFRSSPVLMVSALGYLTRARGIGLREVVYGAFDARRTEDGVAVTPVFDLSPVLVLQEWTGALAHARERGDYRVLAGVVQRAARSAGKALGRGTPSALSALARPMEQLAAAIVDPSLPLVPERARAAVEALRTASTSTSAHAAFAPLAPLIGALVDDIAPLIPLDDTLHARRRAQLRLVAWTLDRGLHMQGFTFLRETAVDLLGDWLTAADATLALSRRDLDRVFGLLSSLAIPREGQPPQEPPSGGDARGAAASRVIEACKGLDPIRRLGRVAAALGPIRNALDHAGTSGSVPQPDRLTRSGHGLLVELETLTPLLLGLELPDEESRRTRLHLLLNHTPTEEQRLDALSALRVSELVSAPADVQAIWGDVDPDAPDVGVLVSTLGERLSSTLSDGDIVWVQGEAGLTHGLVAELSLRGHRCVYATTRRVVRQEETPDGVRTERIFRHVRFRDYPA